MFSIVVPSIQIPTQQCKSVPFSPHPCNTYYLFYFYNSPSLGVKCYLTVIWTSLISGVEHLSVCPFSICTFSLEERLFTSSAHFLIILFVPLLLGFEFCIYLRYQFLITYMTRKYFSLSTGLPVHFVHSFPWCAEVSRKIQAAICFTSVFRTVLSFTSSNVCCCCVCFCCHIQKVS